MPTGYTAGIIDGTTQSFEQYAKLCMRAFGATIHMRDDSLKEEYVPRTPGDYHTKAMDTANKLKEDAEALSDQDIIDRRQIELEENKRYCLEGIEKAKATESRLLAMIERAKNYVPPTSEHTGIKDFMISQIEETIKWDAATDYYDGKLSSIDAELSTLDAATIRKDMIEKANKDFDYHYNEFNKELERCDTVNKWVEDFLLSLNVDTIVA